MSTAAPLRAGPDGSDLHRLIVVGMLAVWAIRLPIAAGITSSSLIVLASAPLWLPSIARYRWANALLVLSGLALANGLILALVRSVYFPYDFQVGLAQVLHLVGGLGGIGLILWTRSLLSTPTIAVVVGAAMILGGLADIAGSGNAWKYVLSAPVTLMVLGLAHRAQPWITVAILALLSLVGMATNSRSYVGFCALTAALLLFQGGRSRDLIGWARRVTWLALGTGLLIATYSLATAMLVGGLLGEQAQQRSQDQISSGGSLLSGGRPEWTGTVELLRAHPQGFGFGAVPTYSDVWTARAGMVRVGVGTNNGYVDNFMFAGEFKLHSVSADLWSQCGLLGVMLAVALIVVMGIGLLDRLLTGRASAVHIYLGVMGLWNMAFSPIYSALAWVAMAAALLLSRKTAPHAEGRSNVSVVSPQEALAYGQARPSEPALDSSHPGARERRSGSGTPSRPHS